MEGAGNNVIVDDLLFKPEYLDDYAPEQQKAMGARVPMGRAGLPEDLVGAYLFLASDAMSGWITGATIDVNGGAYFG